MDTFTRSWLRRLAWFCAAWRGLGLAWQTFGRVSRRWWWRKRYSGWWWSKRAQRSSRSDHAAEKASNYGNEMKGKNDSHHVSDKKITASMRTPLKQKVWCSGYRLISWFDSKAFTLKHKQKHSHCYLLIFSAVASWSDHDRYDNDSKRHPVTNEVQIEGPNGGIKHQDNHSVQLNSF